MPALAVLMRTLAFCSVLDVSMFVIASVAAIVKQLSVVTCLAAVWLRLAPRPRLALLTVDLTCDFSSDGTVVEL